VQLARVDDVRQLVRPLAADEPEPRRLWDGIDVALLGLLGPQARPAGWVVADGVADRPDKLCSQLRWRAGRRVFAWEKQALSARDFKRVGRHSECAI
jgi:hypothetical protein